VSFLRFARLQAHVQLLPALESGEETLIGGQAVMEGVMMRSPNSYCVAVRKSNGEIVTEAQPVKKVSEKYPLFKLPVLRGVGTLGQAMSLGIRALKFSANAALEEVASPKEKQQEKSGVISTWVMTVNLLFSLVFFIFLYKFVPLWLTSRIEEIVPAVQGRIAFNVVDGLLRLLIFLGFLYLVSRWRDIRRVFEYHGAEHRVVFNFESGQEVNVANAQKFETWHPRCGTSFLLVVMLISMGVYTLLPFDGFGAKFASRIALLPLIAGLSYEVIRYAARKRNKLLLSLTAPGLWLQRITTQTPSDDQTAVAIHALEGALELERQQGGQLVIA
jgi:uncharacterized protein YqhQ